MVKIQLSNRPSAVLDSRHLITRGPFGHQLTRQLVLQVLDAGVGSSPHQQLYCCRLTSVILQRTDHVQGCVPVEVLEHPGSARVIAAYRPSGT